MIHGSKLVNPDTAVYIDLSFNNPASTGGIARHVGLYHLG
jgi:hypothetical protein